MADPEITLGAGVTEESLEWVPLGIQKCLGQVAIIDEGTVLLPPDGVIRQDRTTLFACSGIQAIYPQLFDGAKVPSAARLISQPVIRTQHLKNIKEGTSTSFVNYNLFRFGVSEDDHAIRTNEFFSKIIEADERGHNDNQRVLVTDWPQTWNGLPVLMNTNEKLWINGVELGESIFFKEMPLPNGQTTSVSELAFGLERLVFATSKDGVDTSYYSRRMGGYETQPAQKTINESVVCDTIKSTVLMAMQGLTPSNKSHGYQMRKFIKSTVTANEEVQLPIEKIIESAYRYWACFFTPSIQLEDVRAIINDEYSRNINRRILDKLRDHHGIDTNPDINQSTVSFKNQLRKTGFSDALDTIDS